jgi:branched-chain amino acid transport system ATP-binding protein
MLDEPASGLRHEERKDLASLIEEMRSDGVTIMLVEHDVAFVTRVADTMTVLDLGKVIAEGRPAEVFRDPQVVAAYIGSEAAA